MQKAIRPRMSTSPSLTSCTCDSYLAANLGWEKGSSKKHDVCVRSYYCYYAACKSALNRRPRTNGDVAVVEGKINKQRDRGTECCLEAKSFK